MQDVSDLHRRGVTAGNRSTACKEGPLSCCGGPVLAAHYAIFWRFSSRIDSSTHMSFILAAVSFLRIGSIRKGQIDRIFTPVYM